MTFITRKLGHFTEYFLLGAELMLLALLLRPALRLRWTWLLLFAGAIAAMDESLQLTSGRGAAVSDVLLDIFGALSGLMMMALAAGYSAFIAGASDLEARLRAQGIDTVLIAGTLTNVCCESSARDAMMLNFRTVMVTDANAAMTDAEHNASLINFYLSFGDVLGTAEIEAGLVPAASSRAP